MKMKRVKAWLLIVVAGLTCHLIVGFVVGCGSVSGVAYRISEQEGTVENNRSNWRRYKEIDARFLSARKDAELIRDFGWGKPSMADDMFFKGFWPFAIFPLVDLPLAATVDVLCLPYDTYTALSHKNNDVFWTKVLSAGEGTPEEGARRMTSTIVDDLEYVLHVRRNAFRREGRYDIRALDIIIQASVIANQERLLAGASIRRELTEEQLKILYDWLDENPQSYYANVMRANIAKHTERIRKAESPIPMYAKELFIAFPDGNGDFAYDFFQGDLVAPHGSGVVTDVVFRVETTLSEKHRFKGVKGEMLFSGNNGLQAFHYNMRESYVDILPFHAPETGYQATLTEARGDGQNIKGYFVKVRSSDDHAGCYGMITRDVRFSYADDRPRVEFTYYLNPDKTTNLEYNGKSLVLHFGKREHWPDYRGR